jgi:hypothetical protein
MVIITIVRIAGLKWRGKLDAVWETYFIAIGPPIGLSLVAVSAFRALYVSKNKERRIHRTITSFGWYNQGRTAIWRVVTRTTGRAPQTGPETHNKHNGPLKNDIPNGTMTGLRTFIDANGRSRVYDTMDEERGDISST